MTSRIHTLSVAALGTILAGTVLATTAVADHPAGKGGTFRFAVASPNIGFDVTQRPSIRIFGQNTLRPIFEDLFNTDDKGNLIPILGTSVKASDDFKVWRVTLRKGVKYSNGEPFDAQTYVYGLQRWNESKVQNYLTGRTAPYREAVAIDSHTVEFRMKTPFPSFRDLISVPFQYNWFNEPKHAKKVGKALLRNPVGTGPYMLAERKAGNTLILKRNPLYWNKKKQHFDQIVIRVIKNDLSQFQTLKTKGIDMHLMRAAGGWRPAMNHIKSGEKPPIKSLQNISSGTNIIAFNMRNPMFQDKRVRLALAHAVDRDVAIKTGTSGMGIVSSDFWAPSHKFYCKLTGIPEYNPEKAKALLKDYGKPVKFKMITQSAGSRGPVSQAFQIFWRRVGVEVELDAQPRNTHTRNWRKGNFQAMLSAYQARVHPANPGRELHSKHKNNSQHVNFPAIDAAFDAAAKVSDPTKLKAAYCKAHQAIVDSQVFIWAYHAPVWAFYGNNVEGLTITANNIVDYQHGWFK